MVTGIAEPQASSYTPPTRMSGGSKSGMKRAKGGKLGVELLNGRGPVAAVYCHGCQSALCEPGWNGSCLSSRNCTTNEKGELTMDKFMSVHTFSAGAVQREQIDQLAQAARNDPIVRPYRSFL